MAVGNDETKAHASERAAKGDSPQSGEVDSTLEEDVMRVLLDPGDRNIEEIDELLTRCAAEALRLQADRVRTESSARALEADRVRMFELMAEVRALRERIEESQSP
jgi:hypothetical protein